MKRTVIITALAAGMIIGAAGNLHADVAMKCNPCNGTGKIAGTINCSWCKGRGFVFR